MVVQQARIDLLHCMELELFELRTSSAVVIQGVLRGHMSRQVAVAEQWLQGQVSYTNSADLKARLIQQQWRKFTAKRQEAAALIQHAFRSRQVRHKSQVFLTSIRTISRAILFYRDRTRYETLKKQRLVHGVAALTLQRYGRGFVARRQTQKLSLRIVTLQAAFRSYLTRKLRHRIDQKRSDKMGALRQQLRQANESADETTTLGYRTTLALKTLLRERQINPLINALSNLGVTTRFSQRCCMRLVEQKGVSIILELMRNCNRSKPHQEMLRHAIRIITSLSMFPATLDSLHAAGVPTAEVLMDLIQNFRDNNQILVSCIKVLRRMHANTTSEGPLAVKSVPEIRKRIQGIATITKRKLEVDSKKKVAANPKKGAVKPGLSTQDGLRELRALLSCVA